MAESLVKKAIVTPLWVWYWAVASLYYISVWQKQPYSVWVFALLVLTREVMRDLDVWDEWCKRPTLFVYITEREY